MQNRFLDSAYFTDAHREFSRHVARILAATVRPFGDHWEFKGQVPRSLWRTIGDAGLLGLPYAASEGGAGADIWHSLIWLDELGYHAPGGLRAALSVHSYMASHYLGIAGSSQLKRRYLAPAIGGRSIGALAISEIDAGSQLGNLGTVARRDGDCYVVNGRKVFVTNGCTADFITIAVRTGRHLPTKRGATGISLLVIDSGTSGLTRQRTSTIGWRCCDVATLYLRDVRVSAENLIGTENFGFHYLMSGLQLERLVAAAGALGEARRCLDLTVERLMKPREAGGRLIDHQVIRHQLAEMETDLNAAYQLVHQAAWKYQRGDLPVRECSMAKLRATELVGSLARRCLQLHGAAGCLDDATVARIFRDSSGLTLAGGASEVLLDAIAQNIVDLGRPETAPPSELTHELTPPLFAEFAAPAATFPPMQQGSHVSIQ